MSNSRRHATGTRMTMVTTAGSTLWLSIVAAGIFLATGASAIGPVPECGNVNRDADVNLSDAVYLLNALFIGGPAVECASADDSCADVNGDDEVNLSDAAYLLNHLFLGGPEPRCGGGGGEEIEGFTAIGENAQGGPSTWGAPQVRQDARPTRVRSTRSR